MKSRSIRVLLFICLLGLLIASCGGASQATYDAAALGAPDEFSQSQPESPPEAQPQAGVADQAVIYETGASSELTVSRRINRLIIKNAEMRLLVEDSEVAMDRATQVIDDVGGYIISSRTWYEEWGDHLFQSSTITIGVPSDQFERTLRRLRDIAIRVLDENATGEDVTDEYVDLQSQLDNLEATRDRIRGFLDQAENVEEALQVNNELSKVEGQIEEIKGRINYLSDRSAYSTITITIEPELNELPTPTPHPTSTPVPWNPAETYGRATNALSAIYKGLLNIAIWMGVVTIPVIGPFVIIGWLLWRFSRRKVTQKEVEEQENA